METSKLSIDVDEIDDLIFDVSATVDSIIGIDVSNSYDTIIGTDVTNSYDTITLTDSFSDDVTFNGEITINKDCETIKLLETLKEQKMQIEDLSEIIADMVIKKDFNIEYDLEKRVEQKRFLNKLGGK